jgi:hypothetical protein
VLVQRLEKKKQIPRRARTDIRNKLEQRTVADSKSAPMESNLIALFLDLNNEPTTSLPHPLHFLSAAGANYP